MWLLSLETVDKTWESLIVMEGQLLPRLVAGGSLSAQCVLPPSFRPSCPSLPHRGSLATMQTWTPDLRGTPCSAPCPTVAATAVSHLLGFLQTRPRPRHRQGKELPGYRLQPTPGGKAPSAARSSEHIAGTNLQTTVPGAQSHTRHSSHVSH